MNKLAMMAGVFVALLATAAAAGIKPMKQELSPQGKVMADCIAFYEALATVIGEHDPSVLTYSGAIGDGTPEMVLKHAAATNRATHIKKAFPRDLIEMAKEEYARVYDVYKSEIKSTFPKGNKEVNMSLEACTQQNKWLHARGQKINGYLTLSFD